MNIQYLGLMIGVELHNILAVKVKHLLKNVQSITIVVQVVAKIHKLPHNVYNQKCGI